MHQLDNEVFDIIDARCNHEGHIITSGALDDEKRTQK